MKILIKQELLSKALRRCLGAAGSGKQLNPIHALVKLDALQGPDRLVLTATNGLISIETSVEAKVASPGSIAMNTREFSNAASAMPLGDIAISNTDKVVKIVGSTKRTWSGPLVNGEDIKGPPEPKAETGAKWLKLPIAVLAQALERQTVVIGDALQTQTERRGLRIEAAPSVVATIASGHHMFMAIEGPTEIGMKGESWIGLIPEMALGAFRDLMEECTEAKLDAIELYTDGSMFYATGPSTLLVAALPVGDYPPWRLLMEGFPSEPLCTLGRLALIESIKACLATTAIADAGASFRFKDCTVFVERKDPTNTFDDSVPIVSMRPGLDMRCRMSLAFLHTCLRSADMDPELFIDDNGSTVLLRTSSGYRAVLSLMAEPQG
jgi:DNA polymerase III sliding clamp (beta) subunit (PCNA family)